VSTPRSRGRPGWPRPNTVEASPSYRRYLAAAAWAGGSGRNWDHSVRPVLAELVELTMASRVPPGADPRAAARALLGPELWALVDPDKPGTDTSITGRNTLTRILDRLDEQGTDR
jgi:hypothetical protein